MYVGLQSIQTRYIRYQCTPAPSKSHFISEIGAPSVNKSLLSERITVAWTSPQEILLHAPRALHEHEHMYLHTARPTDLTTPMYMRTCKFMSTVSLYQNLSLRPKPWEKYSSTCNLDQQAGPKTNMWRQAHSWSNKLDQHRAASSQTGHMQGWMCGKANVCYAPLWSHRRG